MNTQNKSSILSSALIILIILTGLTLLSSMTLSGPVRAQGPDGGVGAQAAVGTAFTYQGQLMYNGSAISGTCSLSFKLYDASSGGNQVGSTVTNSSVSVSDGLFSVALDFGDSAFTGEARWLEIIINSCPGGAGGVTLSPRVALNPAPYALSLRPGAVISSANIPISTLAGLYVQNSNAGDANSGIVGLASNASDKNYGVQGRRATAPRGGACTATPATAAAKPTASTVRQTVLEPGPPAYMATPPLPAAQPTAFTAKAAHPAELASTGPAPIPALKAKLRPTTGHPTASTAWPPIAAAPPPTAFTGRATVLPEPAWAARPQ